MIESSLDELGREAKKASLRRFDQLFADIRLHKNFTEEKGIGPSFDMDLIQKELQPLIDIVKSGELSFEDLPEDIQYILGEWDLSELFPQKKTLKDKNAGESEASSGVASSVLEKRKRHVPNIIFNEGFSSFFSRDELRYIREIIGRARLIEEDHDDHFTLMSPQYIFSIVAAMVRIGISYKDLPAEFTQALSVLHIETEFQDVLKGRSAEYSEVSLGSKLSQLSNKDRLQFLRIAHAFLSFSLTRNVYGPGQRLKFTSEELQFFKDCMKEGNITFEDLGLRLYESLLTSGLVIETKNEDGEIIKEWYC